MCRWTTEFGVPCIRSLCKHQLRSVCLGKHKFRGCKNIHYDDVLAMIASRPGVPPVIVSEFPLPSGKCSDEMRAQWHLEDLNSAAKPAYNAGRIGLSEVCTMI